MNPWAVFFLSLALFIPPAAGNLLVNHDFEKEATPPLIEGFWITDERTHKQWGATRQAALTNELSLDMETLEQKPPNRENSDRLLRYLDERRQQYNQEVPPGTWATKSKALRKQPPAGTSANPATPGESPTHPANPRDETIIVPPSSWSQVIKERVARKKSQSIKTTSEAAGGQFGEWTMRIGDTISDTGPSSLGHQAIVQYVDADPGKTYTLSAMILWQKGSNQTIFLEILDRKNARLVHATASPTKQGEWQRIATPPLLAPGGAAYAKAILYSCKPCKGVSFWDSVILEPGIQSNKNVRDDLDAGNSE